MKRMSKLIGLPVVMEKTGKKIGRTERVCLCADGQLVQGMIISLYGFGRRRFVEMGNILLMGEVSLVIKSHVKVPKPLRDERSTFRVQNTDGQHIGWMTDSMIDETDGRVRAIEVSFGYLDDVISGRLWVSDFTLRPCGVIAVVRPSAMETITDGPPVFFA